MFLLAQIPPQVPELPKGPDLQSIRGPVDIPAYTTLQISLFLTCLIGTLLLIAWLLYRHFKQSKPTLNPSAYATFKTELKAAQNTDPADPRFPDNLSKTLRHYLISISESNAFGASSKELVGLAAKHPAIKSSTLEKIETTLRHLDHARFQTNARTSTDALHAVEAIVDSIEAESQRMAAKREEAAA